MLVDYHRTGGFAGFDDRLVIFDNGAGVLSSKTGSREILVNQTVLNAIASTFTTAQFSQLEANYTAAVGTADLLHYTISYHGKTVNTEESATPPDLLQVINLLDQIILESETSPPVTLPQKIIPTL